MKEQSNIKPSKKFKVENVNNNKCEIVFFDNIKKITEINVETLEENTIYKYDLYRLKDVNFRRGLITEITDNYDKWLEEGKLKEKETLSISIKNKRDKLLTETDWTQMADSALEEDAKEKYKEYRQALRDIPQQENFPYNVEFPMLEV